MHFDTKRLPLLKGQSPTQPGEYLFVAIDDFSRELYAAILPDKIQNSATWFLIKTVIAQCPYQIDYAYSDNVKEYKGTDSHAFVKTCKAHGIGQKFTQANRLQTYGKAERAIRTLMQMWHDKTNFKDCTDRQVQLGRFINFYNTVSHTRVYITQLLMKYSNIISINLSVNNPEISYS